MLSNLRSELSSFFIYISLYFYINIKIISLQEYFPVIVRRGFKYLLDHLYLYPRRAIPVGANI